MRIAGCNSAKLKWQQSHELGLRLRMVDDLSQLVLKCVQSRFQPVHPSEELGLMAT